MHIKSVLWGRHTYVMELYKVGCIEHRLETSVPVCKTVTGDTVSEQAAAKTNTFDIGERPK